MSMYLDHFGLHSAPFNITPDPDFFFAGGRRGEILEALIYAVLNGDGIVKVTGEVGSGKTMLCRMLESQLPDHVDILYLMNPTLDSTGVVFALAGELGLPTDGRRGDEVMRSLQAELISRHAAGRQVVLLIEEAQAMSLATLEEIRLITNLETARHKLLQVVMFGQPELDTNLNVPSMRQTRERITNSFRVPPLERAGLPDYLLCRLRAAGLRGALPFSTGALDRLHRASRGIVRRASILADKSMLAAYSDSAVLVETRHVAAAIADSEFAHTSHGRWWRWWPVGVALTGVGAAFGWLVLLPATAHHAGVVKTVPHAAAPAVAQVVKAPPVAAVAVVAPQAPAVVVPAAEEVRKEAAQPAQPAPEKSPLERDADWLAQQPHEQFCLQVALIAGANPADALAALHRLGTVVGSDELHVYAVHNATRSHFGIIYGSFASREQAQAELARLATRTGLNPQLRTVGGILREQGASP